ncbi:MAG: hypothetical protein K0S07_307 [Chlamydiales bacterium]|jgi:HEAT repeat protein|nr:hypothetical protein [Chlamydiales bacterium]
MKKKLIFIALWTWSCSTAHAPFPELTFAEPSLPNAPAQPQARLEEMDQQALDRQSTYLLSAGKIDKALSTISKNSSETVLRQLAKRLLTAGVRERQMKKAVLSLYGAALSGQSDALQVFRAAFATEDPQLQVLALKLSPSLSDDEADEIIHIGLSSPYFAIRLESAFLLAEKQSRDASLKIEALVAKAPPELKPLLPPLLSLEGSDRSLKLLEKLLEDPSLETRLSALLETGKNQLDQFTPQIQKIASHSSPLEQEAAARQLGSLQDNSAKEILQALSKSGHLTVRLSALRALYQIGQLTPSAYRQHLLQERSPFIFDLLANLEGSAKSLEPYLKSPIAAERLNALIALVEQGDETSVPFLQAIFAGEEHGITYQPMFSLGHTLHYWEAISLAGVKEREIELLREASLRLKEHLLQKSLENLPRKAFFALIETLFQQPQVELTPLAVQLLENLNSEEAVVFLKAHQNQPASPLIRAWCNLSLYRMQEKGPFREQLLEWIRRHKHCPLIELRPELSRGFIYQPVRAELSPQETSRLLFEMLQALVAQKDDQAIELLLEVIHSGNPENRSALAGLLLRACQ